MYIRTDVMGSKIHSTQRILSKEVQETMERLSTGLRINGAKDDAAGLAISERLTKNINGNKTAVNNIDDGINLLKTGQGTLSIVQEHLQRIREISIQMQNGTYNESDKGSVQKELDQILKSIDNLAITTRFNQDTILNKEPFLTLFGSSSPGAIKINSQPQYDYGTSEFTYSTSFKLTSVDVGNQILRQLYSGGGNLEIQVAGNKVQTYIADTVNGSKLINSSPIVAGQWYEVTVSRKLNQSTGNMEFSLYLNGNLQNKVVSNHNLTGNHSIYFGKDVYHSDEYTDGTIGNIRMYSRGFSASEVSDYYNGNVSREDLVGEWIFDKGYGEVVEDTSLYKNDGIIEGEASWNAKMSLHNGSGANDTYTLGLTGITTDNLGIKDLSLNDFEIIRKIDSAMRQISSSQTKFGTAQNVLEFKKEYTENSTIQLEQSRSRIQDTDMATTSSKLMQEQIKMQSTFTMLRQNNDNRGKVIQLLGG